jgi:hypothetical protein
MSVRTSEHIDQLAPALAKAQMEVQEVRKGGHNTYDKYNYATLENFADGCREACRTNELAIVTGATPREGEVRQNQKGNNEYLARLTLTMRLVHSSGQWIEIDMPGEGQDRGDKGIYKANTGARKYALACLLGLVTSDDPESGEQPDQSSEPARAQRSTPKNGTAKNGEVGTRAWLGSYIHACGVPVAELGEVAGKLKTILYPDVNGNLTDEQFKALCEAVRKWGDQKGGATWGKGSIKEIADEFLPI